MDHIRENVKRIFKSNNPDLDEDFDVIPLIDLGINSLLFIKIIVELELFFSFEFEDEDLDYKKFAVLNDVVEYIARKT